MRKLLTLFILCFAFGVTIGQSATPQVISTSGGQGESADYKVEWTLGELAITTLTDGNTVLTQDLQHFDGSG